MRGAANGTARRRGRLLELQSPYPYGPGGNKGGLLPFQQPSDCETILTRALFGLDNGEHPTQLGCHTRYRAREALRLNVLENVLDTTAAGTACCTLRLSLAVPRWARPPGLQSIRGPKRA